MQLTTSARWAGADLMAAIRSYITKAVNKLRTRVLISQLEGLFDTALAANVYDNLVFDDCWSGPTPTTSALLPSLPVATSWASAATS